MEDESNIRLAYATHEDIAACCPAETVLAVRVREPCANFSIIIFFILGAHAKTPSELGISCWGPGRYENFVAPLYSNSQRV